MRNLVIGLILFFNAALGIALYHLNDPSSLTITTLLAVVSTLLSLYINKENFVYFFRVLVISWVGLVPALAIWQGAYFAIRMPYVQTEQVGWIFGILVCTTLFSSQIGFWLVSKVNFLPSSNSLDLCRAPKLLFSLLFCLLLVAGYLLAEQEGDFVFQSAYGADQTGRVEMPVQNIQSITAILLGMLFIVSVRTKHYFEAISFVPIVTKIRSLALFFALLYVVVWAQFLRGARMDPVGFLILLYILYYSVKRQIASLTIKYLMIAVVLISILQVWGAARNTLAQGISLAEIMETMIQRDAREVQGVAVLYFQGTFNNISVGVAGAINAVEKGLYFPLYGGSYLDFIGRIPPAFIYPNRPTSLAWFSEWIYNDSSGGGMNEMGEIYLNFGIYGSLFVPGIISFAIGWAYKRHMMNPLNIWISLPFLGFFGVYTRGLLYQTFDAFKSLITAYILYLAILVIYKIVNLAKRTSVRNT
jgi:hypothetical protein